SVHDLVELRAEQLVDLGDAGLERGHRVVADGHPLVEHLRGGLADQVSRVHLLVVVAGHAALLHDAVEERELRDAGGSSAFRLRFGHRSSPRDTSGSKDRGLPVLDYSAASSAGGAIFSCWRFSVLITTSWSRRSRSSLPSSLVIRSARRWRASNSLRSGSTCCSTLTGSKSSMSLNFSSTFILLSSTRRFSTWKAMRGAAADSTSLK